VDSDDFVDLNPGATTPVVIVFDVVDTNGYTDIDDSGVLIRFNYDAGGEPQRDVFNCPAPVDDGLNTKTFTCTVDMSYYDAYGDWTATVDVSDFLGLATDQKTHGFQINLLRYITLTPPTINFGVVSPGQTNIPGISSTTITNYGNFDIPGDSKIQITSQSLVGQTTPSETISGNNFRSAESGDVCTAGTSLIETTPVDIPNVLLSKGPSSTETLDYCLTIVPIGLSAQDYSTQDYTAWDISIVALLVAVIPLKRKRRKDSRKLGLTRLKAKPKKKSVLHDEQFLKILGENLEDLLEFVKENKLKSKIQNIEIPLDVFKQKISPAEAICKYLKENKNLKFSEIAIAINRNQRTVWINYRNAVKKQKEKIKIKQTISIPINTLNDRRLSILESIVKYLKNQGLNNSKISKLIGKTPTNIWTLHKRAIKKLE